MQLTSLNPRDEETLVGLVRAVWRAKWFLVTGALVGILVAVLIIVTATPFYRAEMLVAPVKPVTDMGDRDQVSMRDVDRETLEFERYVQILTGPAVVRAALKAEPELTAKLSDARRFWFLEPYDFSAPDKLADWLKQAVALQPVGATPLRRILFEHPDGKVAQQVLMTLHITADAMIRAEVLQRTEERLRYLNATLAKAANPDHRRALTDLLLEQERTKMMVRMDRHFAATLVEAPFIQPRAVWPRKSYILALLILVGMIAGWIAFGVAQGRDAYSD